MTNKSELQRNLERLARTGVSLCFIKDTSGDAHTREHGDVRVSAKGAEVYISPEEHIDGRSLALSFSQIREPYTDISHILAFGQERTIIGIAMGTRYCVFHQHTSKVPEFGKYESGQSVLDHLEKAEIINTKDITGNRPAGLSL